MKKYQLFILMLFMLGTTSCYHDDSSLPSVDKRIKEIAVGKMDDVNALAFSILNITPVVNGYPEDQLDYAWYIYGNNLKDTQDGYRTYKIGDKKTLSYKVDVKAGQYTIVFEATERATGYAVTSEVSLTVSTLFSQGFYILKETPDGNTDIDLYNVDNEQFLSNVLSSTQGKPMKGKPKFMSIVYDQLYLSPETAQTTSSTSLFVSSGQNEFACFRTNDLLKIFDRSSLLFDQMEEDEIPYSIVTAACNYYFSSKGVRTAPLKDEYATGKMSYPLDEGGSQYIQPCDGTGFLYWNEQKHSLMYVDNNRAERIEYFDGNIPWKDLHAVSSGWNHLAGENTIWFLLESTNRQRYLVLLNKKHEVTEVRRLASNLHIAQAEIVAGNALTAYSLYAVDNNKLYQYSMDVVGTETSPLSVDNLPADEKIVYLSDIFFAEEFDYIVIGTQNNDVYTLYMYKIKGGHPYGSPVHTIKGTGKLKNVRYVSQAPSWHGSPNYYAFTEYAVTYGMKPDYPY